MPAVECGGCVRALGAAESGGGAPRTSTAVGDDEKKQKGIGKRIRRSLSFDRKGAGIRRSLSFDRKKW